MKFLKNIWNNDIFRRAVKTFIQAFLASLIMFLNNNTTFDEKMLKSALLGALAGGLSALMNFIITLLDKEGGVSMEEEKVVEEAVAEETVAEEVVEEPKEEE